jgi:hypothetical protein
MDKHLRFAADNLVICLRRERDRKMLKKQIELFDYEHDDICLQTIYLLAKWN